MSAIIANDSEPDRFEEAGHWCMRLADGGLSAEDQARFEAWLEAAPDNRLAFEQTAGVWNSFGEQSAAPEAIALRAEALEAFRAANRRRWSIRDRGPWQWLAAVAAMLLVIMVPAGLWYSSLPAVYETGVGERELAVLDDGSKVSLDAATRLEVKLAEDRREVVLNRGRAKFDVARDALRPFSVRVGGKIVVATGTSFSVELLHGKVHVILYEGHVSVVDTARAGEARAAAQRPGANKGVEVELNPGTELVASLAKADTQVTPTDVGRSLSWESGQLTFVDEPLRTAVERVNRYSDKKIALADPAIGSLPVNGVYNAGDVEAFAVGVNAVLPVRVADNGATISISRR